MTEESTWIASVIAFFRSNLVLMIMVAIPITFLVFSHGSEIVYNEHPVFTMCNLAGAPKGKDCIGSYEILLGNTGSEVETIHLKWPVAVANWERSLHIQNIAADEPRERDPELACDKHADVFECVLEQFSPGTLLTLYMRCMPCGGKDIEMMNGKPANLETSARLYQGNPRNKVFFRRVYQMISWLI